MSRLLWGFLVLTLTGVLAASGWSWFSSTSALRLAAPQLAPQGKVPSFSLIDQTAQPFSSAALKGRIWIADFIFTSCPGSCPQMTGKMASLQRRLPSEIQLVSFSVDPTRDTPEVLAEYADRYGAQAHRWHFLTGNPDAIARLAHQGFHLSYAEGASPKEPITHSVRFALVDRAGVIRGTYDSTEPSQIRQLIRDAETLHRTPADG